MATVNKIDISGLEGNEAAQPRVFAHSANAITPASSAPNAFVYVVPNTGTTAATGDLQAVQTRGACLYIGGAGNIQVELESGDKVTFKGVTAGSFLPILVTKIFFFDAATPPVATTTATDIIALF